eukprot:85091_1
MAYLLCTQNPTQQNNRIKPQKYKNYVKEIVCGYTKNILHLIPSEIVNIIILFYGYPTLVFNSEKHGENLKIIDGNIVKKINVNGYELWFFGEKKK